MIAISKVIDEQRALIHAKNNKILMLASRKQINANEKYKEFGKI